MTGPGTKSQDLTARDLVIATIRRSLGVCGTEAPRRLAVAGRLGAHPVGVVPARGYLPPAARVDLFVRMVEAAAGTAQRVSDVPAVAQAAAAFLRSHDLPLELRRGNDPRLAAIAWDAAGLRIRLGAADGHDLAAVSHAFAAVAETGTMILTSGADNPTTLNFLPATHIVVVSATDVAPDFETAMARLRERYSDGRLPRNVNLITGPSRSADIEQTLVLGAHGPRQLHVIVVGEP
jgi:L-lactate dehydrogenase complex protein LldG